MDGMLSSDLKEFLQLLNEEHVEYLLVGGWAVAHHGYPRFTQDMDIWVAMRQENAVRVVRALERFGFSRGESKEALFLEPGNIVRFGFPPSRIEIMNQISGVDFDECIKRMEMADFDGFEVPVISRNDLLSNKKASGRHKDLADIEGLIGESEV